MKGRARAAQLAGVSALAIMASFALPSRPAMACDAIINQTGPDTNFVTVTCEDDPTVDVENSLFTTSHNQVSGTINFYDGSGDDELTINGGQIQNVAGGPGPPATNIPGLTLNPSETDVQTLGGNDVVNINGGTIVGGVDLGDDDDTITVNGAATQIFFDIDGGEGADTITVNAGAIAGSIFGDTPGLDQGNDTITAAGGTILGSIISGGGDDVVSVSGAAQIGVDDEESQSVLLDDGNDAFTMTGGTLEGGIDAGAGDDTLNISGGTIGDDIFAEFGADVLTITGGTFAGSIFGNDDDDVISISGATTIAGDVDGGEGNDTINISGGTIAGSVFGDTFLNEAADDTIAVSAGIIDGSIFTGAGDDAVSISGTAQVGVDDEEVQSVLLGAGNNILSMSGGALIGGVSAGSGNDILTFGGGSVGGNILADDGDDSIPASGDDFITVSGSAIGGSIFADDDAAPNGNDTIVVSAGSVGGSIFTGDGINSVTISGGLVGIADDGVPSLVLGDDGNTLSMSGGTLIGDVFAGIGDDELTFGGGSVGGDIIDAAGNDAITVSGADIAGSIFADDDGEPGDDTIVVSAGSVGGSIFAGDGFNSVTISGGQIGIADDGVPSLILGDDGNTLSMSGGTLIGDVFAGIGDDELTFGGGSVGGDIIDVTGNDSVTVSGAAIAGSIFVDDDGEPGDDTIVVSAGSVGGSIFAGDGFNSVTISGGTLFGGVSVGAGDDELTFDGGGVGGDVFGGAGVDTINVSGTAIAGSVFGGDGQDKISVSGGSIGQNVSAGAGDEVINVSGGTIGGAVLGDDGKDTVIVTGGTIVGGIDAETVQLLGGTILGNITGLSENTLIIQAENLTLANGVLFQGTNVVGTITGTNLAGGSINFVGFNTLQIDGQSTLQLAPGVQQIAGLQVLDGSTLVVPGSTSLVSPTGGPGNLTVSNATLSMQNGTATDIFNLGNVALNNARLAIDVNGPQNVSDVINAAGVISAAGANVVAVNLIGLPSLVSTNVIPLAPVSGEIAPAGGAASPFFTIDPNSPLASLFDLSIITGADGGLYLLVAPTAAAMTTILEPRAAIDSQPIETVTMTVYDILNDAVLTQFNLLASANRADAAPGFGIYASGQAAFVSHDGFNISGAGISGQGPSFTANDFSLAASVELNAAEYFGIDKSYGLDVGMFGGYAMSQVDLDPTEAFANIGSGDNRSGMIGGYSLFRSGTTYALASATGFFGNTDIINGILNSTGNYGTAGVAVTGAVGHVYQINESWRFDLRGGLLGVYFEGDSFEDSQGNDFGRSHISFGAVKLEPGIFAQYPMEDGRILSPYARLTLTQRFGYENESSLEGVDFFFDDADFSAALAGGVNYQVSKTTTLSSEVLSKVSSDSNTFAGKIGIKARF